MSPFLRTSLRSWWATWLAAPLAPSALCGASRSVLTLARLSLRRSTTSCTWAAFPIIRRWCSPVITHSKVADEITGLPYRQIGWGKYDILVLPRSFPYGGMENPCLTFLTPSLLAGDRSMVNVVIHELSHSWVSGERALAWARLTPPPVWQPRHQSHVGALLDERRLLRVAGA